MLDRDATMGRSSRATKRRMFWSSLKCWSFSEPKPCWESFVHRPPKWASPLPAMGMRRQEIGLCDDLCSPMMNKPSLASTLMCGQIARSLALVMTTSQCIAALIACFVLSEAPALQSGRHLSPSLPRTGRYRSLTYCLFSSSASAIDHSLGTRHLCGHRSVWMRHGRLEAPKIMSTKWNRWDWMKTLVLSL